MQSISPSDVAPLLGPAFQRFAEACRADSGDRQHFTSAEPYFQALSHEAADLLPGYERAAAAWNTQSRKHIRRIRATRDLQAFFDRRNTRVQILSERFDANQMAMEFEREVTREHCSFLQRFVLDGLELTSNELKFRRGRFVKLNAALLGGSLEEDLKSYDRRRGLYALELPWRSQQNPPWDTGICDDAESSAERIHRLSHPWVAFINLWEPGKIRAAGVFESSDSQLIRRSDRYLEISEPIWQDHYKYNPEKEVDEWDSESPRRTVRIKDENRFVKFLEALDDGLIKAAARTHRADISMRYVRRVAENFWTHHIGGDGANQDQNEDIIVDAVTALECMLLAGERRGKGDILAARAAAILEEIDSERRRVRRRIQHLYKLRSAILHGDVRPPATELIQAATDSEEYSRRCLVVFLLSGGDHQALIEATKDPNATAAFRRVVSI